MEEQINESVSKLSDKLSGWFDAIVLNLPNFLIAVIVFVFCFWLSRNLESLTNRFLKKYIRQPSVRGLISNVLSIVLIMLGLILALAVLNLDGVLKSLLAGAGIAGLAISLALQGTLSNVFSGLYLAIKDEIKVGDWVETNGYAGKVVEIGLRNTKIKEADNNIVVIPNKMIVDNPFKNHGLTERIRSTVTCGVGYESDLKKVKEITINAIKELFPPAEGENIEFYYTEFTDSSINFMVRFWVDGKEKLTALEVKSMAIMKIKEVFDRHDINIPFPIRTLIQQNS